MGYLPTPLSRTFPFRAAICARARSSRQRALTLQRNWEILCLLSLPYTLQIFRVQCKATGEYFIRRAYLGVEYRGELWLRTGGLGWTLALAILQACVSKCVLRGGNWKYSVSAREFVQQLWGHHCLVQSFFANEETWWREQTSWCWEVSAHCWSWW